MLHTIAVFNIPTSYKWWGWNTPDFILGEGALGYPLSFSLEILYQDIDSLPEALHIAETYRDAYSHYLGVTHGTIVTKNNHSYTVYRRTLIEQRPQKR